MNEVNREIQHTEHQCSQVCRVQCQRAWSPAPLAGTFRRTNQRGKSKICRRKKAYMVETRMNKTVRKEMLKVLKAGTWLNWCLSYITELSNRAFAHQAVQTFSCLFPHET